MAEERFIPNDAAVSSRWIASLDDALESSQCGAKAARLAELLRLGFRVPQGFVVNRAAFEHMLASGDLGEFIDAQLAMRDEQTTLQISQAIEERLLRAPLPDELADAVTRAAAPLLEQGPVAVRSSANGEDSAESAFAGQLDSFLHIENTEQLLEALKRCWASYWSHRSLEYQRTRRAQLAGMGVLVQQQVEAEYAGVLFTQDAVRPEPDKMTLEYCAGLGDALVSGEVRPTRLVIAGGACRVDADEEGLGESVISRLAEAGRTLENHFQQPQDIEWATDAAETLHLVQTRPITTRGDRRGVTVWSNANVNENFPDAISPLLYSIARVGYYHYFRNLGLAFGISADRVDVMEYPLQNIVGTHGGRLYYNLTNIHKVLRAAPSGEFLAASFNQFVGAGSAMLDEDLPSWRKWRQGRLSEWRQMLRIAMKTFGRFRNVSRRISVFEKTVDAFAADAHPDRLDDLPWDELLQLWRRFMEIRSQWTDAAMADAASMISYGITQRFLAGEFQDQADRAVANRLLSGLCNIVSGLPTEELWELSRMTLRNESLTRDLHSLSSEQVWRRIESDDELGEIRQALHEFLEQWGFRCSGELMLTIPSYQERPAEILDVLRAYVNLHGESPRELLARQQQDRERETERILGILAKRRLRWYIPWPRKDRVARRFIRWTQESVSCRERARLKQALLYSRLRRLALVVGRLFQGKGFLKQDDEIFFLTYDEIESVLAGRAMFPEEMRRFAEIRRSAHERVAKQTPPDRIELTPGQRWIAADHEAANESDDGGAWRGSGVCGGAIVGRAVVLDDPSQLDQVEPGDILVTRQTDPGWGPILFLVRGLVMERGGMLSHGAILAREFGIPCVVDIREATRRIQTGERIRVDGDQGVVEILGE